MNATAPSNVLDLHRSRSIPIPGLDVSLPPVTSAPLAALDSAPSHVSPLQQLLLRSPSDATCRQAPDANQECTRHQRLHPQQQAVSRKDSERPVRIRWSHAELSRLMHGLALAGADLPKVARVVGTRNVNAVRKQLSSIAARIAPPPQHQPLIPPHVAARLILHHHGLAPPPGSSNNLSCAADGQNREAKSGSRRSRQKYAVQVVAALPAQADFLRQNGHNPCVEILLGTHKTVWDILFHLYSKWGRPLALQDPSADTLQINSTVEMLLHDYGKDSKDTIRLTYTLLDARPDFEVVSVRVGANKRCSSDDDAAGRPCKRKRDFLGPDAYDAACAASLQSFQPRHAMRRRIFAADESMASELKDSMRPERQIASMSKSAAQLDGVGLPLNPVSIRDADIPWCHDGNTEVFEVSVASGSKNHLDADYKAARYQNMSNCAREVIHPVQSPDIREHSAPAFSPLMTNMQTSSRLHGTSRCLPSLECSDNRLQTPNKSRCVPSDNAMDSFGHEDLQVQCEDLGRRTRELSCGAGDVHGAETDRCPSLSFLPDLGNSAVEPFSESIHNVPGLGCFSTAESRTDLPQSAPSLTFSALLSDLAHSRVDANLYSS